jgi:pimeloyl-ACP methyl ester carboxylesterase
MRAGAAIYPRPVSQQSRYPNKVEYLHRVIGLHERYLPDMQTKFVEANGLRFEVLEEGTGDRLALCLHGFPEHAISWRYQIPVLAGMGDRVWAVNQRGYGRTTRRTQVAHYAPPHLVDDVTALINAASAKNVVLIGHDWGAMVAWCFAAQRGAARWIG